MNCLRGFIMLLQGSMGIDQMLCKDCLSSGECMCDRCGEPMLIGKVKNNGKTVVDTPLFIPIFFIEVLIFLLLLKVLIWG